MTKAEEFMETLRAGYVPEKLLQDTFLEACNEDDLDMVKFVVENFTDNNLICPMNKRMISTPEKVPRKNPKTKTGNCPKWIKELDRNDLTPEPQVEQVCPVGIDLHKDHYFDPPYHKILDEAFLKTHPVIVAFHKRGEHSGLTPAVCKQSGKVLQWLLSAPEVRINYPTIIYLTDLCVNSDVSDESKKAHIKTNPWRTKVFKTIVAHYAHFIEIKKEEYLRSVIERKCGENIFRLFFTNFNFPDSELTFAFEKLCVENQFQKVKVLLGIHPYRKYSLGFVVTQGRHRITQILLENSLRTNTPLIDKAAAFYAAFSDLSASHAENLKCGSLNCDHIHEGFPSCKKKSIAMCNLLLANVDMFDMQCVGRVLLGRYVENMIPLDNGEFEYHDNGQDAKKRKGFNEQRNKVMAGIVNKAFLSLSPHLTINHKTFIAVCSKEDVFLLKHIMQTHTNYQEYVNDKLGCELFGQYSSTTIKLLMDVCSEVVPPPDYYLNDIFDESEIELLQKILETHPEIDLFADDSICSMGKSVEMINWCLKNIPVIFRGKKPRKVARVEEDDTDEEESEEDNSDDQDENSEDDSEEEEDSDEEN